MLAVVVSDSFRAVSGLLRPVGLLRCVVGGVVFTTDGCNSGPSKSPKSSSSCTVNEGCLGSFGAREREFVSVGAWVDHSGMLERVGTTSPQTSCCKA